MFGLARSGLAAARALVAGGAVVACWDDGERGRAAAEAAGLPLVDLRQADWSKFAALVLAPGVPLTHPEPNWTVKRAKAAGVEVIGDTELFFRELAKFRSLPVDGPKVVGITGTNGKSTTTALTAHLLRHAGKRVAMGGNIGEAVLGLAPFAETDVYVLELSSYQIDLTGSAVCDVGVLLNLSPDHLDRHGSMERYASVKARLTHWSHFAVFGLDDVLTRGMALQRIYDRDNAIGIHVTEDLTRPADAVSEAELKRFKYDRGDLITAVPEGIIGRVGTTGSILEVVLLANLTGIATLRGAHNAQNATAAVVIGDALGIDVETLQRGLQTYPGLAHRMEVLGNAGAATFVNDSKATNADSTAKALNSFATPIHWILGGKAKDGGIESLTGFFGGVAHAYLIGEASESFARTLTEQHVAFTACRTLDRAVAEAGRNAGRGPATVLLSPACASFDQFKDFEDRGDQFRRLVEALPGFVPYGAKTTP